MSILIQSIMTNVICLKFDSTGNHLQFICIRSCTKMPTCQLCVLRENPNVKSLNWSTETSRQNTQVFACFVGKPSGYTKKTSHTFCIIATSSRHNLIWLYQDLMNHENETAVVKWSQTVGNLFSIATYKSLKSVVERRGNTRGLNFVLIFVNLEKQVAFQSNANHLLAESMGYLKFEGM